MNFHYRNKHLLAIKTQNGETRTCWIITFLLCLGCILLCLYFWKFHNGFSTNQDDLGNFGSYICGIASIFNVIIFTWLTISIQRAGDEERKKDREHKQLLLITQIRKEELINLEKTLNDTLQITDLYLPAFFKYQNAQSYLLNYAQSHKALFPLLDDKDVEQDEEQAYFFNNLLDNLVEKVMAERQGIPKPRFPRPAQKEFNPFDNFDFS